LPRSAARQRVLRAMVWVVIVAIAAGILGFWKEILRHPHGLFLPVEITLAAFFAMIAMVWVGQRAQRRFFFGKRVEIPVSEFLRQMRYRAGADSSVVDAIRCSVERAYRIRPGRARPSDRLDRYSGLGLGDPFAFEVVCRVRSGCRLPWGDSVVDHVCRVIGENAETVEDVVRIMDRALPGGGAVMGWDDE